jgi:hypothetical protein
MKMHSLPKDEWKPFCERFSKALTGAVSVELEVVSLSIGDRLLSRWVPLVGIAYDPRADSFEIALPGVDHTIAHPQAVSIDETTRGIVAIEITASEGRGEILKLREPFAPLRGVERGGEYSND